MQKKSFDELREKYPVFRYKDFHILSQADGILLTFDFAVDGLCEFHPTTKIMCDNLTLANAPDSDAARATVFSLGLVEAVSYWKCACPKKLIVECGCLSQEQKLWWKKLWFNGLGEFFFINGIAPDFDSFVEIECESCTPYNVSAQDFCPTGLSLVPVGGGKDSAVTLSLLGELSDSIRCFTVNDQPAREQTVTAAGLSTKSIVRTYRKIDPQLLRLNADGFFNGHTPFSAIVAFLSLYCAYLIGAQKIILSNESSANEASVGGTGINHQYSKSYEFERDFTDYTEKHLALPIKYFSLLRPFNELQIAKQFAALPQYRKVFKSCNAGSKTNVWCGKCAKCLFVCIILSPFLSRSELIEIFGCDMLDNPELEGMLFELAGFTDKKPFECVGTVSEVVYALRATLEKYRSDGEKLPALLQTYLPLAKQSEGSPLADFNKENNVPECMIKYVKEMYRYVSAVN